MTEEEALRICPHCGYVASSIADEVAHMEGEHRDVIAERLRVAGMEPYEVIDARSGPDLPSFMTLSEFRIVHVLIEWLAINRVDRSNPPLDYDFVGNPQVSILVRDRGRGVRPHVGASWIEISVDGKQYAIWRATMALYEVDEHGAVKDDPISSPDD
jgi:hypothetical protein